VLWVRCSNISAEEDAAWVEQETAKLLDTGGVVGLVLHQVESAAQLHPRGWDWCLEVDVDGEPPNAVVRRPPWSGFLADLRLLGTRPRVIVLPEPG
jgi:hypothetical protein